MTHLRIDNSATLWSVPREARAEALGALPLLVIMHGWGSDVSRIFPIATVLPHRQRMVVAAIRGPVTARSEGFGWFSRPGGGQDGTDRAAFADPCRAVIRWLGTIEMQYEQALPRVAIMGFSQGGAMATHLMRMNPHRFTSAVNLSGYWPAVTEHGDAELAQRRPPLFWGRDEADPMIRMPAVERTRNALGRHVDLDAHCYDGVGHGIVAQELVDVSAFLERTLLAE